MYHCFADLITAYLEEHLKGKASYARRVAVASQWIRTLTITPTYDDILARMTSKGHGHFEKGSGQANEELSLLRAACRWGIYTRQWQGGDPTAGVRRWKRPRRNHPAKHLEIIKLREHFMKPLTTERHIRDRALFGLMFFTGCRPSEARSVLVESITPYGEMGCWKKGETKNGEPQELPLPAQLMPWLDAWKAIRSQQGPYLFPGQVLNQPLTDDLVRLRWKELRLIIGLDGLWNYDLRKTLVQVMGNVLKYDTATIRAILNHVDNTPLGRYYFKDFDSLIEPIQHYANWLWELKPIRQVKVICYEALEKEMRA